MQFKHLVFAITLAFAGVAHAQTPEQLAAVERAAAVGWEMYEHDQAAWHGTDAMLEDIRDPRGEGLSGWITERTPEGIQVLFLKPQGETVTAIYRALYREGQIRERGRINQPFFARPCVDTSAITERELAAASGIGWIGKNTLVLNEHDGSLFFIGVILT